LAAVVVVFTTQIQVGQVDLVVEEDFLLLAAVGPLEELELRIKALQVA